MRGAVGALVATPFRCALLVALLLGLLAGGRWLGGGKSWGHFAVVGTELADPPRLPVAVPLVPGRGYDGQFFLRMAMDPWPDGARGAGITLDDPAYRHQRIALPALAWALSLGKVEWAPAVLVLVNLLALACAVWTCAALAREMGRPPALGLGLLGISGLLLAFGRDLAEPLVILFLSVAALGLRRERVTVAALALTAAVLAREDALLAVLALAAARGVRARTQAAGGAGASEGDEGVSQASIAPAVVLPLAVLVAWQAVLWAHWGRIPALAGVDRLTLPLTGLVGAWSVLASQPASETAVHLLYLLWHGVVAVEVGRGWLRSRGRPEAGPLERWSGAGWVLWTAVALFFATPVWGDEWAFARVLAPWAFFGFLLFLSRRWTPSAGLVVLTLVLAAGSAGRLLLRP